MCEATRIMLNLLYLIKPEDLENNFENLKSVPSVENLITKEFFSYLAMCSQ